MTRKGYIDCPFCYAQAQRVQRRTYRCSDPACGARWKVTRDPKPYVPPPPEPPPDPRIAEGWRLIREKQIAMDRGEDAEAARLDAAFFANWRDEPEPPA